MWIFTKQGFFSGVVSGMDDTQIVIRARSRRHLMNLQRKLQLSATIDSFPGTDYQYRMSVPKGVWVEIVCQLAEDVDYTNFKGEVALRSRTVGAKYVEALHDIWGLLWKAYVKGD